MKVSENHRKMSKLVLHVPHAGTAIPDKTGYTIPENDLEAEQLLLNAI